jgi:uncharacterized protein YecT (DUF1311 family)
MVAGRWKRAAAVAIVLAGLASGAGAQDAAAGPAPNCETAETQQDLNACAALDFQEADADLNDAYAAATAAMARIDQAQPAGQTGAVEALKAAERAWIAYRDLACAAEGWPNHGGTVEPLVVSGCKTRLTSARAEDLWSLADAPGSP